jgi:hypothetical protein
MSKFGFDVMPVDVFRGAGSDMLVLCQEWPSIDGEEYVRIVIPMREAEDIARRILREAQHVS